MAGGKTTGGKELSMSASRFLNPPNWIRHAIRLIVGGVFVYAGVVKWTAPRDFAAAIDSFHLLPAVMVSAMAIVLPPLEVLAGGLWACNRYTKASAACIVLMCLAFLVALTYAWLAGIPAQCGCFGELFGESLPLAIARDVFLGAATAYWLSVTRNMEQVRRGEA